MVFVDPTYVNKHFMLRTCEHTVKISGNEIGDCLSHFYVVF